MHPVGLKISWDLRLFTSVCLLRKLRSRNSRKIRHKTFGQRDAMEGKLKPTMVQMRNSRLFPAQGEIECFECNSWDDPRCHDPFNYTIHDEHMPEIKMCEGCCVKMVQFIGTGWPK